MLFGFSSTKNIEVADFEIRTPEVNIGSALTFSFQLKNNNNKTVKIRLEYGLYYQKANGSLSKKVFKISEKDYLPNSVTYINRKQSFKLITTRKFHLGLHRVAVIGMEMSLKDMILNWSAKNQINTSPSL